MKPARFGRYETQSLLGKGSMGEVYRAHDPLLKRDVAIKVVRFPPGLQPSRLAEMKADLLKEARLAAHLAHRGIVRVFDVGEQDDLPFIVLELIGGRLLSEILKQEEELDVDYASRVFLEVLSAMAYAHEQGVVHLDLKPTNIILEPEGQPRIMDFGIARTLAELRQPGALMSGTPRYMAPEQILGQGVDPRTDVFALGAILYLMLSGRLPFPQEDYPQLRRAIAEEPHPPLETYRPNLPRSYCEFVDRALSKAPRDRWASAGDMLKSFSQCRALASRQTGGAGPAEPMSDEARQEILKFILQRIQRKGDFPAISQYVAEVVQAARSRSASAQTVAECILKDFALTSRVLRMANSAYYQGKGSQITTISRAVVVLGMDAILNLASALGIFEHFLQRSDVRHLKEQVIQALFTALNAREIANQMGFETSEEPFICGMLHHLGRLIVSFYFPDEQQAIEEMLRQGAESEEEASRAVMRLSYLELGQAIAEAWRLPKLLQTGMGGLDTRHTGPLQGKVEMLQGITSCAHELGKATMITDDAEREIALANLARKYESQVPVTPKSLQRIVSDSVDDAANISAALRLSLTELGIVRKSVEEEAEEQRAEALEPEGREAAEPLEAMRAEGAAAPEPGARAPDLLTRARDRRPASAADLEAADSMAQRQEFLTRIIADIAMTLTGPFDINDIMMMVLEGMYRGLEFHNVMLALVTPKHDRVVVRFGLGPATEPLRQLFNYPLTRASGAPASCVLDQREILIQDVGQMTSKEALPESLIELLEPKSVLMLPVVVKDTAIGLFLATRSVDQLPVSAQELQSARMLVSHAVLALHRLASKK